MDEKCVITTWLFKTDLSNMNAGEGSTNLKELKTYNNGLPYISGQSVRHALRKSIQRENPQAFRCTPEFPCGKIDECWLCDMFGYLLPKEGAKRWSPIKASPALGQIRSSVTTDLIFRMVQDIECPKCHENIYPLAARGKGEDGSSKDKNIRQDSELTCPKCNEKFKAPYDIRQALAYKQLTDNIYRANISLDIAALGVDEIPKIVGEGANAEMEGMDYKKKYNDEERLKRVTSVLNAIANISDFANQSREMTNASPDMVLISIQDQYNHKLSSALRMDEEGNIDKNAFKDILQDCLAVPNTKIFAGLISGIINNEADIRKVLEDLNENGLQICGTPRQAMDTAIKQLNGN
ncbi:MAG: hypothetical protein FGO69_06285 [Methanobacterium sp.]|jgi:CRISPR-associated protein Cst2|nr:MAG: hypothetical protein FGO69_06285 [Methanobacterium sp.]